MKSLRLPVPEERLTGLERSVETDCHRHRRSHRQSVELPPLRLIGPHPAVHVRYFAMGPKQEECLQKNHHATTLRIKPKIIIRKLIDTTISKA